MARGKQRIRQRGSRQQWAQARTLKSFDGIEKADSVLQPPSPIENSTAVSIGSRDERIATIDKCGLCGLIVEHKRVNGSREIFFAYALCASCDETRCLNCWDADDDSCADSDAEHEFVEIYYSDEGTFQTMDFHAWVE